jgi:oligo-1,6-glucosidase
VEGRFALLLPEHETLWAFTRTSAEATLLVLANLSSAELPLPVTDLPDLTGATLLLGSHADSSPTATTLAPWESRILQLA